MTCRGVGSGGGGWAGRVHGICGMYLICISGMSTPSSLLSVILYNNMTGASTMSLSEHDIMCLCLWPWQVVCEKNEAGWEGGG